MCWERTGVWCSYGADCRFAHCYLERFPGISAASSYKKLAKVKEVLSCRINLVQVLLRFWLEKLPSRARFFKARFFLYFKHFKLQLWRSIYRRTKLEEHCLLVRQLEAYFDDETGDDNKIFSTEYWASRLRASIVQSPPISQGGLLRALIKGRHMVVA